MSEYYSAKDQNKFYNGADRCRIPVDSNALLLDPEGRLLIVKPAYKPGWALPGGMSDTGESPLSGLLREVMEEVNISLERERMQLAGIRYVAERNGRDPYMQVYFKSNLDPDQIAGIRLPEEKDGKLELSEYRFALPEELLEYTDAPRMAAAAAMLDSVQGGGSVYLENETPLF